MIIVVGCVFLFFLLQLSGVIWSAGIPRWGTRERDLYLLFTVVDRTRYWYFFFMFCSIAWVALGQNPLDNWHLQPMGCYFSDLLVMCNEVKVAHDISCSYMCFIDISCCWLSLNIGFLMIVSQLCNYSG
jgi:hypothetical protein